MSTCSDHRVSRELAVVYLARHAEGLDALREFVGSYRAHAAGMSHDLVVVFKGFPSESEIAQARRVFAEAPHLEIAVDDSGFDVGAYFKAARRLDHHLVCFLNTHTRIAADGWLAALHRQASRHRVGAAGAMGSYESLATTLKLFRKVGHDGRSSASSRDGRIAHYFDFVLQGGGASRPDAPGPTSTPWGRLLHRGYRMTRSRLGRWLGVSPWDLYLWRFPRFPNPHLRSNGFMIERERFLSLAFRWPRSKWDTFAFESGSNGLTAQLRRRGLATIVVDCEGTAYDVDQWYRSDTFRMGDQRKLLLTDNQTRLYAGAAPGHRAALSRMTWGDYLGAAPDDFPNFGFEFARAG